MAYGVESARSIGANKQDTLRNWDDFKCDHRMVIAQLKGN